MTGRVLGVVERRVGDRERMQLVVCQDQGGLWVHSLYWFTDGEESPPRKNRMLFRLEEFEKLYPTLMPLLVQECTAAALATWKTEGEGS